jgi:hypothetical protein
MRLTAVLSLCLALGFQTAPAAAQTKQGQKMALLVGVQKYSHPKLPDLRFCENDVTDLAEVLRKAGYKVTVLCDSLGKNDPTLVPIKANIDKQLVKLLETCKDRHDTVLLAFAGHGLQFKDDKDDYGAFFCPCDGKPFLEDRGTLVSMKQVYKDLERSFAGFKVLLVDACRNSAAAAARSGIDSDSAPRATRGMAVLFSCAAGEVSREHEAFKHGVFFHFVLEGLRGKASNPDGLVTIGTLADYVSTRVANTVPSLIGEGAQQSPQVDANIVGASPVLLAVRAPEQPKGMAKPQTLVFTGGAARANGQLDFADGTVLTGNKAYKEYHFQGEAGKTYQIDLQSQAFNAYLYLKDETGKVLMENNDGGPSNNDSRIVCKLDKTGLYRILATSLNGQKSGAFTLSVAVQKAASLSVQKLIVRAEQPTRVQGTLTKADAVDAQGRFLKAFAFQAEAGRDYQFEMTGQDGLDALLRIEDAAGKLVKEEDFGDGKLSRVKFTPAQGGTYRAIASAFKDGMTGGFTLTAVEVKNVAGKVLPLVLKDGKSAALHDTLANQDATTGDGKHFKVYAFQAAAGKSYQFEMTGKDGLDPQMRVTTQAGETLKEEDFGDGKLSRLAFSPPGAGTYHLVASTFEKAMVGAYSLAVTAVVPVTTGGSAGYAIFANGKNTLEGTLSNQDPTDGQGKFYQGFPFKGEQGKRYRFEMTGKNGLAPYVRIANENGQAIKEEDFGNDDLSRVVFEPMQTGTYRIVAVSFKENATGNFTLTATREEAPQIVALNLAGGSTTVDGSLTAQDAHETRDNKNRYVKSYLLQADANRAYRIELHGKNGFEPSVRIENAQGNILKEEDFGDDKLSRLQFSPAQGGAVRVVVSSFKDDATGGFTLLVTEVERPNTQLQFASGKVAINSGVTEEDPKDASGKHFKAFTFQAEQGKTYRFEIAGRNDFSPIVRIENLQGQLVRDEEYGDDSISRVTLRATQGGTYRVVAGAFKEGATGDFTLTAGIVRLQPLKFQAGQVVVNGELSDKDPQLQPHSKAYKEYTFYAEAGKVYQIDMNSRDIDCFLYLKDDGGRILAWNDDVAKGNLDSRITHCFDKSGTYHIVATNYNAKNGPFTLTVANQGKKPSPPDGKPFVFQIGKVAFGAAVTAQDSKDGQGRYYKQYTFLAEAGKIYTFTTTSKNSKNFSPLVWIETLQSHVVRHDDYGEDNVSRIQFQPTQTGPHRLVIAGYNAGSTGEYQIQANVQAAPNDGVADGN